MTKKLERGLEIVLEIKRNSTRHHGRKKDEHRERKSEGGRMWIQEAIKNPGALHKALHVPKGEKIPQAKIEKAENSKNLKLRREANLADTLKKFHNK